MQDVRRETLGTLPVVSKYCPTCGAQNQKDTITHSIHFYGYFDTDYSCRCAACGVECHYHPIGEIRP